MSRITRALLRSRCSRSRAGAARRPRRRSCRSGRSTSRSHAAAPPRRPVAPVRRRARRARSGSSATARRWRRRSSTSSAEVATDGERGLLSIAFPPDYGQLGPVLRLPDRREPVGELQVREYRRSAADPRPRRPGRPASSGAAPHPRQPTTTAARSSSGPTGCCGSRPATAAAPTTSSDHARDAASQLGKVLRIDPRPGNAGGYTIPADNPFGTAVWAYGLRNPFRFSFDRATGDLLIGDVGEGTAGGDRLGARLDGRGRGADYGWPCREGTVPGPRRLRARAPRYIAAGVGLRRRARPARGDRRLRRARPRPADARGPLRLRGHLRRRRALAACWRSRRAIDDRRRPACRRATCSSPSPRTPAATSTSCRSTARVDRIQDGAPGPCRLQPPARPLPGAAPRAGRRPAVPDRTSPRVRHPRSRARAASGRRATPRIRAHRHRDLPRDDRARARRDEAQARAHAAARRPPHDRAAAAAREGGQAHPQRAAAPPAGDAGRVA